jgi:hypothetical protein
MRLSVVAAIQSIEFHLCLPRHEPFRSEFPSQLSRQKRLSLVQKPITPNGDECPEHQRIALAHAHRKPGLDG